MYDKSISIIKWVTWIGIKAWITIAIGYISVWHAVSSIVRLPDSKPLVSIFYASVNSHLHIWIVCCAVAFHIRLFLFIYAMKNNREFDSIFIVHYIILQPLWLPSWLSIWYTLVLYQFAYREMRKQFMPEDNTKSWTTTIIWISYLSVKIPYQTNAYYTHTQNTNIKCQNQRHRDWEYRNKMINNEYIWMPEIKIITMIIKNQMKLPLGLSVHVAIGSSRFADV